MVDPRDEAAQFARSVKGVRVPYLLLEVRYPHYPTLYHLFRNKYMHIFVHTKHNRYSYDLCESKVVSYEVKHHR